MENPRWNQLEDNLEEIGLMIIDVSLPIEFPLYEDAKSIS